MIDKIYDILNKYVDVFGFVSVNEYINKRSSMGIYDVFKHIPNITDFHTIIILGISYPSKEVEYKGKGYGILSRYSYGIDYHLVLNAKLKAITNEFEKMYIEHHATVDISDVDERYAAYLANIGYLGKNQFLINKEYGSYLFLATILIDINIDKNKVILDDCGDCNLCVEACPTNALDNGFNKDLCLSSLTQEKKPFTNKEISHLNTMIYGCDICQKVCPKNKGIDFHKYPEFEPTGVENINLIELLNMPKIEYQKLYSQNASSWKGSLVIKRNALCLIGNQKLKEAVPAIKESMVKYPGVSWYNETAEKVLKMLESE